MKFKMKSIMSKGKTEGQAFPRMREVADGPTGAETLPFLAAAKAFIIKSIFESILMSLIPQLVGVLHLMAVGLCFQNLGSSSFLKKHYPSLSPFKICWNVSIFLVKA